MKSPKNLLSGIHPYDTFDDDTLASIVSQLQPRSYKAGDLIYDFAEELDGLHIIREGEVTVTLSRENDSELSRLRRGNSFAERGLLRDGKAATRAVAATDVKTCLLPAALFYQLISENPAFKRFFQRGVSRINVAKRQLATAPVETIMSTQLYTCEPSTPVSKAAQIMAESRVSSLCIMSDDKLMGVLTAKDLVNRVMAKGRDMNTAVDEVMTTELITLESSAIGSDVLAKMQEHHFAHIPIVDDNELRGIVTQSDLLRVQALNSAWLVGDIASATSAEEIAQETARIPELLVQLVATGNRHDIVTRLLTDVADAATRRLLEIAQRELGTAPAPYLWLACGSQGRREQTGVSDQDNCLIIDDSASDDDRVYFAKLAEFVCAGLDSVGYVFCPGDMMASNPRWCQRQSVWREYFKGWIATPDREAQMLASVMFDLRPIAGERSLFDELQLETLKAASDNSIFVAHMVSNSLKHRPPLGLFGGLSMSRNGDKQDSINMKHAGVVPIIDLARLYALIGNIKPVNTRLRLEQAGETAAASEEGSRNLLDAYDLISQHRLEHQAAQIRREEPVDHFLQPAHLSGFDRSHLRDAFVVVRTMQSAIGSRGGGLL